MNPEELATPVNETSLPAYSVDWRFLLPVHKKARMLVICGAQNDFDRSFQELGIPIETMSFDKLDLRHGMQSSPYEPQSFDVVAAPLGLNSTRRQGGRSELAQRLKWARTLIRPGGAILFGFSNRWDIRCRDQASSDASTIFEISRLLSGLGIETKCLYGAVPEPMAPEYIFPLDAQSLGFVLNHRYQHKFPGMFLNLTKTSAMNILLHFLPFYYLVGWVRE